MLYSTTTKAHLPALTGLRFVAALLVLLYHFQDLITFPPILRDLAARGGIGVPLFFVLSGFILTYTYSDRFASGLSGPELQAYALARVARIVPLYVFALLLVTPVVLWSLVAYPGVLVPLSESHPGFLLLSWLASLLMVQIYIPNGTVEGMWNAPAWSVSVEVVFYLCFPFAIRAGLRRIQRGGGLALLSLIVGCTIIHFVLLTVVAVILSSLDQPWVPLLLRSPLLGIWDFLLGCGAGVLFGTHRHLFSPMRGLAVAAGSIAGLAALLTLPDRLPPDISLTIRTIDFTGPLFAILIFALAAGARVLAAVLGQHWVVLLGEASYALYLIHWTPVTVLTLIAQGGRPLPPGLALIVMLATIPISIAVYCWIEVPARRWVRTRRWEARTIVSLWSDSLPRD